MLVSEFTHVYNLVELLIVWQVIGVRIGVSVEVFIVIPVLFLRRGNLRTEFLTRFNNEFIFTRVSLLWFFIVIFLQFIFIGLIIHCIFHVLQVSFRLFDILLLILILVMIGTFIHPDNIIPEMEWLVVQLTFIVR